MCRYIGHWRIYLLMPFSQKTYPDHCCIRLMPVSCQEQHTTISGWEGILGNEEQ